jgi:D-glycero-alpha-D-manno-heptose-7-phosphate kinase
MSFSKKHDLSARPIETSVPCRIDLGGTLDISTFYYPLMHLSPLTFNIALDMRTRVRLLPYPDKMVRVSSKGFDSVEYPVGEAPFDQPLGLMFAIAAYFEARGIHIVIESASPPRSALGGSSSAGVALIGALMKMNAEEYGKTLSLKNIALLAREIEALTAQAPCGMQDQLAAAYGGVNAWYWRPGIGRYPFVRKVIVRKNHYRFLEDALLVAYCGMPHESVNINGKWVGQFLSGHFRRAWENIVQYTHEFVNALLRQDIQTACEWMNRETAIRREMTPDVLEPVGELLVDSALEAGCGARFTGAGGGGCLWALGPKDNISHLRADWEKILSRSENACLLATRIDGRGLVFH